MKSFGKELDQVQLNIYNAISSIEKADQGLFCSLTCEDSHEEFILTASLDGLKHYPFRQKMETDTHSKEY